MGHRSRMRCASCLASMTACRRGYSTRTVLHRPIQKPRSTRPFPFNAYYREENARDIDEDDYKLLIDGLVDDKRLWTLDQLYALPQETQITRLVCVEGWSAIGKWTG